MIQQTQLFFISRYKELHPSTSVDKVIQKRHGYRVQLEQEKQSDVLGGKNGLSKLGGGGGKFRGPA